MDFVTELTSNVVVERKGLENLSTEKMAEALATIYSSGKTVIMVDSAVQFFSNKNLLKVMDSPNSSEHLAAILEQRGVQLSVAEMNILSGYHTLKERVMTVLRDQQPLYDFAEVPEGWDVDTDLVFLSKTIRRANDTSYTIGYKTLERIWKKASMFWAGYDKDRDGGGFQASGYWNTAEIYDDRVKLGCQSICRYEIEQVAVKMGWQFPKEPL